MRNTRLLVVVGVMCILVVGALSTPGAAQAPQPWQGKNLQVFPKDITRPALMQRMREFSFALDVSCQHCHAGGDGRSFQGVVFESDDKPAKRTARAMLRMMATLNESTLPALENRGDPPVKITCTICHRGLARPMTLGTELTNVINRSGVDAAVARYRSLRKDSALLGLFRYDEWSMNELARELGENGKVEAAVAMLELNAEYYPRSVDIDQQLAELYLKQGNKAKAIAQLEAALVKDPRRTDIKQRLEAIKGG